MLHSGACEYAIRALTYLAARERGVLVQLDAVAHAEDIPAPFLGKILQILGHAGLVRSSKGRRGGWTLARSPDAVTLLEIHEAVEGRSGLDRCAVGLGRCSDRMPCPLHDAFKPLREAIRHYLATTTLAAMATAVAEKRKLLVREREARAAQRHATVPASL